MWHIDAYRDAVWESDALKADAKAVAEIYARHARDDRGDKSTTADVAWVTYPRLMAMAGFRRRQNLGAAIGALIDGGWLTVVEQIPRRSPKYRLTIPGDRSSTIGTTEHDQAKAGGSTVGTTSVGRSSTRSSDGGTSVVPLLGAGSSDGGTQPLLPPPSTSSYAPSSASGQEGEEDPQTQTPEPRRAIEIVTANTRNLTAVERARIARLAGKALAAGHSPDDVAAELRRPTAGLSSVAAGLIGRMTELASAAVIQRSTGNGADPRRAEYERTARAAGECPHRVPGGAVPRPWANDTPVCPQCRAETVAAARAAQSFGDP